MARPRRFAPPGVPLHIRCRGNQRQDVFFGDADRRLYLELMVRHCREHGVRILGYCLMTNHVHLILEPSTEEGVSASMQRLSSEYAQAIQYRFQRTGHLWHGRFKATPMDESYVWTALRYVELNPSRARIVARAEDWPWSSAGAHLGTVRWPGWLDGSAWQERFSAATWRVYLGEDVDVEKDAFLRRATRENRPLASPETVTRWETEYGVELLPQKVGRPRKLVRIEDKQMTLFKAAG